MFYFFWSLGNEARGLARYRRSDCPIWKVLRIAFWSRFKKAVLCFQTSPRPVCLSCQVLTLSFSEAFVDYMYYCRAIRFEEEPDYDYLRKIFRDLFRSRGFEMDYVFDWNMNIPNLRVGHNAATNGIARQNVLPVNPAPPVDNGLLFQQPVNLPGAFNQVRRWPNPPARPSPYPSTNAAVMYYCICLLLSLPPIVSLMSKSSFYSKYTLI